MNQRHLTVGNEQLLHELLQETGMLVFRHCFLDPGLYEMKRNETTDDLEISLLLDAKEKALVDAVKAGLATTAAAHEIIEARCTLAAKKFGT